MASSATCGPSNALSSLQKHSSIDRSLQHERSRLNPSFPQNLRGSSAGTPYTESEFHAFASESLPQPHSRVAAGPLGTSNWTADFHRLTIHAPTHSGVGGGLAPSLRQTNVWQDEFRNYGASIAGVPPEGAARAAPMQSTNLYPAAHFPGNQGWSAYSDSVLSQRPTYHVREQERENEQAFEAAFERAALNGKLQGSVRYSDSVQNVQDYGVPDANQELCTSDVIENMDHEREETTTEGSDELPRTAARLLDSLQHERSEKFQNSTFLALMKRFRDGQASVEGQQVVEKSPSHDRNQNTTDTLSPPVP